MFGGIAADLNGDTLDSASHQIPSFLILSKRKEPVSRFFSIIHVSVFLSIFLQFSKTVNG